MPEIVTPTALPPSSPALRWSGIGLGTVTWISAASFFGMYTLAFYFGAHFATCDRRTGSQGWPGGVHGSKKKAG